MRVSLGIGVDLTVYQGDLQCPRKEFFNKFNSSKLLFFLLKYCLAMKSATALATPFSCKPVFALYSVLSKQNILFCSRID